MYKYCFFLVHAGIYECIVGSHDGQQNIVSINSPGNFYCRSCQPGFKENGRNCYGTVSFSFIMELLIDL